MKKRHVLPVILATVVLLSACSPLKDTKPEQEATVVNIVQTNPSNMLQMLRNREIDGFVAWEPFNALAVKEGTGRYLLQSAQIWPNHPCCILVISRQIPDENLALALVWAHVKATRFINDLANSEKLIKYSMEFAGKDRETVTTGLAYIKYVEFPDNNQFKAYYKGLQESGLLKKTPEDMGYPNEEIFFTDFLTKKYMDLVEDRLAAQPDWIPPQVRGKQKVSLGFINQDLHQIQAYIADREGYYRQVGLINGENLELRPFNNGVAVMEAFKAKELAASYTGSAPATLKRINDNILVHSIAGANNEGSAIVVKNDSSVYSIEQLAGKTIAIPALGTVQHFILDMAVRKSNLTLRVK
jgi:NitT/TauT family transport system substrate-binding protein